MILEMCLLNAKEYTKQAFPKLKFAYILRVIKIISWLIQSTSKYLNLHNRLIEPKYLSQIISFETKPTIVTVQKVL